jgi:hypothetical protein
MGFSLQRNFETKEVKMDVLAFALRVDAVLIINEPADGAQLEGEKAGKGQDVFVSNQEGWVCHVLQRKGSVQGCTVHSFGLHLFARIEMMIEVNPVFLIHFSDEAFGQAHGLGGRGASIRPFDDAFLDVQGKGQGGKREGRSLGAGDARKG